MSRRWLLARCPIVGLAATWDRKGGSWAAGEKRVNMVSIYSGPPSSPHTPKEASLPLTGKLPSCGWGVLRVKPHYEKLVFTALREKQHEEYLPLYRKRQRWSDCIKNVGIPLFSGYVSCRAELFGRPLLAPTPGVLGILRLGNAPALVEATHRFFALAEARDLAAESGDTWQQQKNGRDKLEHLIALKRITELDLIRFEQDALTLESACVEARAQARAAALNRTTVVS
jgi:hypothetical protein